MLSPLEQERAITNAIVRRAITLEREPSKKKQRKLNFIYSLGQQQQQQYAGYNQQQQPLLNGQSPGGSAYHHPPYGRPLSAPGGAQSTGYMGQPPASAAGYSGTYIALTRIILVHLECQNNFGASSNC